MSDGKPRPESAGGDSNGGRNGLGMDHDLPPGVKPGLELCPCSTFGVQLVPGVSPRAETRGRREAGAQLPGANPDKHFQTLPNASTATF